MSHQQCNGEYMLLHLIITRNWWKWKLPDCVSYSVWQSAMQYILSIITSQLLPWPGYHEFAHNLWEWCFLMMQVIFIVIEYNLIEDNHWSPISSVLGKVFASKELFLVVMYLVYAFQINHKPSTSHMGAMKWSKIILANGPQPIID